MTDSSKIPEGFIDLVKIILEQDRFSHEDSPETIDEIWKEMVWLLFLSGSRSDASVNYICGLLDDNDFIDYDKLSEFESNDWEDWKKEIVTFLFKKVNELDSKKKSGILKMLLQEINRDDVQNPLFYIQSAMRYFKEENVTRDSIERRTINEQETGRLILEMYYSGESLENEKKITGVAASKAILFLHSFGKAMNEAPPTKHVKNFINYDIYKREYGKQEENDETIMLEIKDYVKKYIKPMIKDVTVRDVERAVWLWKSTQSLLTDFGRGEKKKLTPQKFVGFIKKYSLEYVKDKLTDIDEQPELAQEVKDFLDSD